MQQEKKIQPQTNPIGEILKNTSKAFWGSPTPYLDSEILLANTLNVKREYLNAHYEELLSSNQKKSFLKKVNRRLSKEPIAYIIGRKEFYGYEFIVNKNVLIPRPETELLVEEALNYIKKFKPKRIVEIGTGSGCIILTIAKELYKTNKDYLQKIQLIAIDNSEKALYIAKKNYKILNLENKVKIEFRKSDLFSNVKENNIDLLISNPPYIPQKEYQKLDKSVKDFEPQNALLGGEKGYEIIEKILGESQVKMNNQSAILLEINSDQGNILKDLANKYFPTNKSAVIFDYSRLERILEIIIN